MNPFFLVAIKLLIGFFAMVIIIKVGEETQREGETDNRW